MAKKHNTPSAPPPDFHLETAMTELKTIVDTMAQKQDSLENSLALFEKGMVLLAQCQKALNEAQQKVQILMKNKDSYALEPFKDQ